MTIWVDADACPKVIKDILFRAATRTQTPLVLVANAFINYPKSTLISAIQVEKGFDQADKYIVRAVQVNDLVITADVPLAADVIAKNALAINPRGEIYTKNNIRQRLSIRDLNEQIRGSGQLIGGPSVLGNKEKTLFANALDSYLTKYGPKNT